MCIKKHPKVSLILLRDVCGVKMRGTLVGFGGRFRFPSARPVFLSKGKKSPKSPAASQG